MYSYIKPILFILLLMITACKTVPVTGRKQLNLVPNSIIQAMAFSQYDSVVKLAPHFHRMMSGHNWKPLWELKFNGQ